MSQKFLTTTLGEAMSKVNCKMGERPEDTLGGWCKNKLKLLSTRKAEEKEACYKLIHTG